MKFMRNKSVRISMMYLLSKSIQDFVGGFEQQDKSKLGIEYAFDKYSSGGRDHLPKSKRATVGTHFWGTGMIIYSFVYGRL